MTIRKITEYPEKVLGEVGKPVTEFDQELAALCADMFETMYDDEGVGLAAPQIGLNLRLFVMDCEGVKLIAANPEIISTEASNPARKAAFRSAKFRPWSCGRRRQSCERRMKTAIGSNARLRATRPAPFFTK